MLAAMRCLVLMSSNVPTVLLMMMTLGLLQVTDTLALVLRQAGHSASRYAGRLFVPPSAVPRGMECAAQQMARTASEELRSPAVVEVGAWMTRMRA